MNQLVRKKDGATSAVDDHTRHKLARLPFAPLCTRVVIPNGNSSRQAGHQSVSLAAKKENKFRSSLDGTSADTSMSAAAAADTAVATRASASSIFKKSCILFPSYIAGNTYSTKRVCYRSYKAVVRADNGCS
ncbi:hypothetical protein BC939DRAFT_473790 [Gamsiella multidivaricata]|uniref:uncharacterized protein n=1 Tax=Gamsiella multidivaricata TaxID=101098 RepID=UPI00221F9923|nr:uncharacterized protein BC939DRAFT_473790 [Gamsiella multidivaricata]KAI7830215.1 hypothetical protein BC939DRAFT_473790 [Gamsiella multidivaricata]